MSLRKIRMSIDIDDCLTAILLDSGDVVIDISGPFNYNEDSIVSAVEERIESLSRQIQRLRLIRDLVKIDEKLVEANLVDRRTDDYDGVASDYRVVSAGQCADCDMPRDLVYSQWENDQVCIRCERVREQEYGIPLVDPD